MTRPHEIIERGGKQPPNPPPPPRGQSSIPDPPGSDLTDSERVLVYARELYQLRYRNAALEAVAVAAQALLAAREAAINAAAYGRPWEEVDTRQAAANSALAALRESLAALEETRGTQ